MQTGQGIRQKNSSRTPGLPHYVRLLRFFESSTPKAHEQKDWLGCSENGGTRTFIPMPFPCFDEHWLFLVRTWLLGCYALSWVAAKLEKRQLFCKALSRRSFLSSSFNRLGLCRMVDFPSLGRPWPELQGSVKATYHVQEVQSQREGKGQEQNFRSSGCKTMAFCSAAPVPVPTAPKWSVRLFQGTCMLCWLDAITEAPVLKHLGVRPKEDRSVERCSLFVSLVIRRKMQLALQLVFVLPVWNILFRTPSSV